MRQSVSVGAGFALAMDRAQELRATSPWRPRIRLLSQFGDHPSGLTIVARIPSQRGAELEAQSGKGVRHMPWSELDARAGELVELVDEAFAEVLAAVEAVGEAHPRPSTAEDLHVEAYEMLQEKAEREVLETCDALVRGFVPHLSTAAAGEACAGAALRAAILCGIAAGLDQPDLVDMLNGEYSEIRLGTKGATPPGSSQH
jgi:hypothetical protein